MSSCRNWDHMFSTSSLLPFAGGVVFKTYVVGDYVRVVRRFSLPDVPEGETNRSGVVPFPRVSCAAESAEEAEEAGILDPQAAGTFHSSF